MWMVAVETVMSGGGLQKKQEIAIEAEV